MPQHTFKNDMYVPSTCFLGYIFCAREMLFKHPALIILTEIDLTVVCDYKMLRLPDVT
jgi:hypothetical protein